MRCCSNIPVGGGAVKKLGLVLMVLVVGVAMFGNPFANQSGGGDAFALMDETVNEVVAGMNGMQSVISGAVTGVLPMLIGIFVVFLVIRFVPRLVRQFTKG